MLEIVDIIQVDIPGIKAIQETFDSLSTDEQASIKKRLDVIFVNGMPLKLKADKHLYIQLFSFMLQLEVIALQIPLRFGAQMKTTEFQEQMRAQLLDEVFHCLLFGKILNHLCVPHAYFPEPNLEMEAARLFIFAEENPDVALVLLNLIGEAWTELLFSVLRQQGVASEILDVVIEDEKRHIGDALLYSQTHAVNKSLLEKKCQAFEPLMLNIFQFHFLVMAEKLCGIDAVVYLVKQLNYRFIEQLNYLGISPSKNWQQAIDFISLILTNMKQTFQQIKALPFTPLRETQMVAWSSACEATMTGQFELDISDLDLFSKKYSPETLTSLMIQTASSVVATHECCRRFLNFNQLYQYQGGLIGIVVKLPNCDDHLATIVLENPHLINISSLSCYIREVITVMTYCYHECRKLEQAYPELLQAHQEWLKRLRDPYYPFALPAPHFISLSNIGMTGLSTAISPLMKNEAMKLTLLTVEKKPIWDKASENFIARDMLPISMSIDHRVVDGNVPISKYFTEAFKQAFAHMEDGEGKDYPTQLLTMVKIMQKKIKAYPGLHYQYLSMLQTLWPNYMNNKKNQQQQQHQHVDMI